MLVQPSTGKSVNTVVTILTACFGGKVCLLCYYSVPCVSELFPQSYDENELLTEIATILEITLNTEKYKNRDSAVDIRVGFVTATIPFVIR